MQRTTEKKAEDLLETLIETCEAQTRCLKAHNSIDYEQISLLSTKLTAISVKLYCENEKTLQSDEV